MIWICVIAIKSATVDNIICTSNNWMYHTLSRKQAHSIPPSLSYSLFLSILIHKILSN